jgi:hypothetical protein
MDDAAWGALAITLTLLGGFYTYLAYQRRGLTAAVRGGAITLLPVAAWLTGVLELLTDIGGAVGTWAADLAFSPTMWFGAGLAGLAAVLFVVSGFLADRGVGARPQQPKQPKVERKALPAGEATARTPVVTDPAASGVDDEMAEIEAILRKRGIT